MIKMSDPLENRHFEDKTYTDPNVTSEHEVPDESSMECQGDSILSDQYDIPHSSEHPSSGINPRNSFVSGGACSSFEMSTGSKYSSLGSAAAGHCTGVASQDGDDFFLVPIETHFKTSKKPKTYMKPVQEDPKEERKRKDAIKSFKNRNKMHQKEENLRSELDRTTEEVNSLLPQRDALRQKIEEMERQLLLGSMACSEGWNTSLPEDYSSQQDHRYHPVAGIQNPPTSSFYPFGPSTESASQGLNGESSHNWQIPANSLPISPDVAETPLGHSQVSFMLPFNSSQQEPGTENPGTYGATPYDSQTGAIAGPDLLDIPAQPSGTFGVNPPSILSPLDQNFPEYEYHPDINDDQVGYPYDDLEGYSHDDMDRYLNQ